MTLNKPYLMAGGALLTGLALGGMTGLAFAEPDVVKEYRDVPKTPQTCTDAIQTLIDSNLEAAGYRDVIMDASYAANERDVTALQDALDDMHAIDANLDTLMLGLEADVNDCRDRA